MSIYNPDIISKIIKAARDMKNISFSGAKVVADNVFSKPTEIMEIIESISSVGIDIKQSAVPNISWTHTIPLTCYSVTDASIAYWTMDSIINEEVYDFCSNKNNLTTNGSVVSGKFGGAIQLDNTKYCFGKIRSNFPPKHFLYFSCWVYSDNFSSFPIIYCKDLFELKTEDNYLVLKLYKDNDEYIINSNNTLTGNTWNYVSFQFNNGNVFLAVNEAITIKNLDLETLTDYCLDNDVYIGQDSENNKATGLFDDVAISAECRIKFDFPCIKNVFSLKNDIAFWPFCSQWGSKAFQPLLEKPPLELFGATWTSGRISNAVLFDGIDSYGVASNIVSEDKKYDSLSIEIQFNLQTVKYMNPLLAQLEGINIYIENNNVVCPIYGLNDTEQMFYFDFQPNEWYNLCYTYDNEKSWLFLNGQPVSIISETGKPTISTNELYVATDLSNFSNIIVDRIRIYKGVLYPFRRPVALFLAGEHGFNIDDEWMIY